jgi:protein TonB
MALAATGVSEKASGSLKRCLVEGDPEQLDGERKLRRRALLASIALESAILAALVLFPLLGKSERIIYEHTIVPPYAPSRPVRPETVETAPPRVGKRACLVCFHQNLTPRIKTRGRVETTFEEQQGDDPLGRPTAPGVPGGLPLDSPLSVPVPPSKEAHLEARKRLTVTSLEPALLAHRVEPVYPPLARQTGRDGRVELHAIIATDGTIQSLEVLSGDPLFYRSALAAVREWRYRPTILDGQAVEIDTHITVIYKLQR